MLVLLISSGQQLEVMAFSSLKSTCTCLLLHKCLLGRPGDYREAKTDRLGEQILCKVMAFLIIMLFTFKYWSTSLLQLDLFCFMPYASRTVMTTCNISLPASGVALQR